MTVRVCFRVYKEEVYVLLACLWSGPPEDAGSAQGPIETGMSMICLDS